jgi:hypothetical protein
MMTSLAALTLEIYYRYLPLFKAEIPAGGAVVDNAPAAKAAAADAAAPPAKKDAAQEKK